MKNCVVEIKKHKSHGLVWSKEPVGFAETPTGCVKSEKEHHCCKRSLRNALVCIARPNTVLRECTLYLDFDCP